MFNKILIANRGEIAVRIVNAAKKMGVKTVTVYSKDDSDSLHVKVADQAVFIGDGHLSNNYLNKEKIIEAALKTGAQAIHPGYGFLSENWEFVKALELNKIAFIGPSSEVIRLMGMKDSAKTLMQTAKVPTIPGYHGANQDKKKLFKEAEKIGVPLLIKAVAGGGGIGMRLVTNLKNFYDALSSARSEAGAAFGNSAVLLEKFVNSPRHIEVQILGDGIEVVHLFDRDCSLQRRYQKIIEEAPACGLNEKKRLKMFDAAIRATRSIGYKGAGTVEFIVDGSDLESSENFWFMEMNTRLQVEHPVTEAVTGIDLVECQIRIAAGERLPFSQDEIRVSGHSCEARIYAEDPFAEFVPTTGKIEHFNFSSQARLDIGVCSGDEISTSFDPMIAKLIVFGKDRKNALNELYKNLNKIEIAGVKTNISFLMALAKHDEILKAPVNTTWLDKNSKKIISQIVPDHLAICAAALAAIKQLEPTEALFGFSLWYPYTKHIQIKTDKGLLQIALKFSKDCIVLTWENHEKFLFFQNKKWSLENTSIPNVHRYGKDIWVYKGGQRKFSFVDPLEEEISQSENQNDFLAPMPGRVKKCFVKPGDKVDEGCKLLILEAMKMEHVVNATRSCIVKEVLVEEGQQIPAEFLLLKFGD